MQIQQNQGDSFEQVAQTLDTLTPLPPNTDGLGAATEQPFDLVAIVLLGVCIAALAGVIAFAKNAVKNMPNLKKPLVERWLNQRFFNA